MAKIVRVLNTTSVEPQEVPGLPGPFPLALSESDLTEKEWNEHIRAGAPLEIVDERGGLKAAKQAQEKTGGNADPAENSEDRPAEVAGATAETSAADERSESDSQR